MGHRLFRFGAFWAVAVLLLVVTAGCQREASVRVPAGATSAAGASAVGTASPAATGLISPVGGATTISVLTPVPGAASATPESGSATGSITATLPLPTPVVVQPAATQTPAASSTEYTLYTVQLGDTLSAIARRYGTTAEAIVAANALTDPNTIAVGQVLRIPSGGTGGTEPGSGACRYYHTVKPGEWIWQIARDYGVDPYDILQANGLTVATGSNISAGDRLCIP